MRSFLNFLRRLQVFRYSSVMLIAAICSRVAFCGEIQDAATRGDLAKVKALIKANPDLVFSREPSGRTPLIAAATGGSIEIVKFLLANGADINAREEASTALDEARSTSHDDIAELLSRQHPDPCVNDFVDAVKKDDTGKMKALLKAHPRLVLLTDSDGDTMLEWAAGNGNSVVAKLLLDNGADVNLGIPLCNAVRQGNMDMVKLLIAAGADVNATGYRNEGLTPLHEAADSGNLEIARLLIAHKANVNARDNSGEIPLDFAKRSGHADVARLLQASGAKGNTEYTLPEAGSPLRKQILDAIRVPAEGHFGQALVFKVKTLRTDGSWAFFVGTAIQPDGSPLVSKKPGASKDNPANPHGSTDALLKNDGAKWKILAITYDANGQPWLDYPKRYGVPDKLITDPAKP